MADQPAPATRKFQFSVDLDATPEDVWTALTDAAELTRWFPTHARIDHRAGGTWAIDWDGDWPWTMEIAHWEPGRRLRLVDPAARPMDAEGKPLDGAAPVTMAVEFTIEAVTDGQVRLRIVHSGFGTGASWDEEIEGVSLGWNAELRVLRHYLRHHRGRTRTLGWARELSSEPLDRLWPHLTSGAGLIAEGESNWLHGGDRCTLRLTTGDRIEGSVIFASPGRHLVVAAENLGNAVFGLHQDRAAGQTLVQVRISSWSWSTEEAGAFGNRARDALRRLPR